MPTIPDAVPHLARQRTRTMSRPRKVAVVTGVLVAVAMCVFVAHTQEASADAGFATGRSNVTTSGFTHPWLGGYSTNAGIAWCIESGQAYPRAIGNTPTDDLPAARGVSAQHRNALAYALWAHSATSDPTTAAGLAAVVHGLSGDDYASVDVPSMTISDPAVKAAAVAIYYEAMQRAFWVSDPNVNPWQITTTLDHLGGAQWQATTTVKTAGGQAIVGRRVGLVPYNVTDAPGTEHVFTTDPSGRIQTRWTQADTTRPIIIDAQMTAPTYYTVWVGPNYPGGSVPQRIVTPNGTIYRGRGRADLPTGEIEVHKTTDNPAYQSAAGATFAVTTSDGSDPVGVLTVGAGGTTPPLAVPVGNYIVTETSAPAGVAVDATPYPLTVTQDATAVLTLTDPVIRQGAVSLIKVDVITGEPVAGARLSIERDSDGDGSFDEVIGTFTSATTPTTVNGLAAGTYRIVEVAAPEGYELPAETTQIVTIAWDQTASVTFADHRSVAFTTEAEAIAPGDDLGDPPAGLADLAHVVATIGHGVRDTISVTGLGPNETANVHSALFGPFDPGSAPVCDADHLVFSDSWETTGSGSSTSAPFTPEIAGLYTWVATIDTPGVGQVSGPCGEISESAILTPNIATVAQASSAGPDRTVTDEITVTGPAAGTPITIESVLHGPFASLDELADSCAAGELAKPVGTVHDEFTVTSSPMVVTSSPIVLPVATDQVDPGGWYTFVETLHAPGFPPISHPCGAPSETFEVIPPPTTTTTTTTPPTTTTSTTTTVPPTTSITSIPPTTTTTTPPTTTTTMPPSTTTSTVPPPRTPSTTVPPTTPATSTTTSTTSTSTTTTSTTSTTAPATTSTTTPGPTPTTEPEASSPPTTATPPVTEGPATGHGVARTPTVELPRTGSRIEQIGAVGSVLILVGLAALLLVARSRIGRQS